MGVAREGFFRDTATVVRKQVQAVMGLHGRSLAVLRRGVYFLFRNARRALLHQLECRERASPESSNSLTLTLLGPNNY
jgi:hypothetical protein